MNKSSENGVWYLLIVFLILMIFIPPIFRLVFPKEEVKQNSNQNINNDVYKTLNCSYSLRDIEDYRVVSKYKNDDINSISFKYKEAQDDSLSQSNIYSIFKNISGIEFAVVSNESEMYTINFYDIDKMKNESLLSDYIKDINNQKATYESLGFTCNISE